MPKQQDNAIWKFDIEGLARAIAARREVLGLTMREAATASHTSAATICRIEAQRRMPDIEHCVLICQWLGMTVDAFVIR